MTNRISASVRYRLRNLLARSAAQVQGYGVTKPPSGPERLKDHRQATGGTNRAIVITTFEEREHKFCLPLIATLRQSGCHDPLVIVNNGNRSGTRDNGSSSGFLMELARFPDVYPVVLRRMVGLARMWNLGIQFAETDVTVVLNDDLIAATPGVAEDIRTLGDVAEDSGLAVGNGSWSHFAIHRSVIENVGWFDERLLGFGEEDGDYSWRYRHAYGRYPRNVTLSSIVDFKASSSQDVAHGVGKYSLANRVFARLKFENLTDETLIESEPPPRPRFDTPDFYPAERFRWEFDQVLDEADPKTVHERLAQSTLNPSPVISPPNY
jgi:hypothetical protein